ncbi:MAG TPA: hypothetical protein VMZ00_13910 [Sporichthya sp.]|nr:hypothetical protein [Sporichthya sp.]
MGQFRRVVKSRTIRGGAVTALTVGALLAPGAGDSRAASRTADGAAGTLQFGAVTVQSIRLNVGPPAASPGDRLIFSHTLTRNGKTAGLSGVECAMTSVTTSAPKAGKKPTISVRSQCVATIVLTDGQIAAQGLTDLADPTGNFELAVTGGTGKYSGAAGTMRKAGGKDNPTYTIDVGTG